MINTSYAMLSSGIPWNMPPVFEELKRFRKLLENFGNSYKVFSKCFYEIFKIFGKSSEVFGNIRNFRKTPETVQK